MNLKEEKISTRSIYDGRILKLLEDTVRLPDGSTAFREIIDHHGGSCVLAIDEDGNLLTVRQHRYAVDVVSIELPAGKLEAGEDPAVCAARELEEETGYKADALTLLAKLHPTPAYCREVIYIYAANGLTKSHQNLDSDEFLQVVRIPFDRAVAMVLEGEITDAKTQIGILQWDARRKKN